jgi:hypothetical protein
MRSGSRVILSNVIIGPSCTDEIESCGASRDNETLPHDGAVMIDEGHGINAALYKLEM